MVERAEVDAIVGLGSNLQPERNLPEVVRELAAAVRVLAVSSAWSTVPVGPAGQLPFVNAAVLLRTDLPPDRLKHERLRDIERRLGRVRSPDRFAPRPIDLDLLAFGDGTTIVDQRPVPDPDLLDHAHLALPASEVAPDWRHPATGETLASIAHRLVEALPAPRRPRRLTLDLRSLR
jgi:2-amino-4-hydroxy-6-hydroxymethyldihydropteridine diphosphokinase